MSQVAKECEFVVRAMKGSAPNISTILPVRNGAGTIRAAVMSLLEQSYTDHEVIVIDDGSTDETAEILKGLAAMDGRVRIVRREAGGIVAALNAGIEAARGVYLARMDADDVALPQRFALQVAHLDANPKCVAVGTSIYKVGPDLSPRGSSPAPGDGARALPVQPLSFPPVCPRLAHPTVMMRADALRAAGGYRDGAMAPAQDRDLWWRLAQEGEIHELKEPLLLYRVHTSSLSRSSRRSTIIATLLADFSAIASALGLDDSELLEALDGGFTPKDMLRGYERLIGARYPLRDYMLYFFVRERVQALTEVATGPKLLAHVAGNCIWRAGAPSAWKVLGCYIQQGFRSQRTLT